MLEIVIWDVQHGSAAYIKTPNNKHIVIDLGTGSDSDTTFSPLLHIKQKNKIDRLDEVIITHPHTDHLDDIGNFDKLNPRTLLRPKHLSEDDIRGANKSSDKPKVDAYLKINEKYNENTPSDENVRFPANNGGVSIDYFMPRKCNTNNINNHSIVTVISYLNFKMIIPGDNQEESWKELLESKVFCKAIKNTDIFVASHHGRENGYCKELFEHFTPSLVIISDGEATTTNASSTYSSIADGWGVFSRSGKEKKTRKCLTTRCDGAIRIKVGKDSDKVYMNVTAD